MGKRVLHADGLEPGDCHGIDSRLDPRPYSLVILPRQQVVVGGTRLEVGPLQRLIMLVGVVIGSLDGGCQHVEHRTDREISDQVALESRVNMEGAVLHAGVWAHSIKSCSTCGSELLG